jgi:hypothetical protein
MSIMNNKIIAFNQQNRDVDVWNIIREVGRMNVGLGCRKEVSVSKLYVWRIRTTQ